MLGVLFNKVAVLQACSFISKRLQLRCFPMNIAKFLRTPILRNICERLLLTMAIGYVFRENLLYLVEKLTILSRVNLLF